MPMLQLDLRFTRGPFELRARGHMDAPVTGITGPSGSGKTTLLQLLAGLLRPADGHLSFDGETLVDTRRGVFTPPWARHFGVVFQEGQLFPHLSVRDNLLFGFRRRHAGERRIQLQSVLDLLEIGPLLERRPAQLSGGERQRVALGRALLCSPRLLLLDEPLSSLDERLKQQILPFLKRIRDGMEIPMVYVTHARSELDFLADQVLTMEDGCLAGAGSGGRAEDDAGGLEHRTRRVANL